MMFRKYPFIYTVGIFIILALPLLSWSPWFYPTDWGKTIIFRSIFAVLLLICASQFFFGEISHGAFLKNNRIIQSLMVVVCAFTLAVLFSVDRYFSLWGSPDRSGGFVNFIFYILFAVFCFLIIRPEDWRKLWDFAIGVGIVVSAIAFIQFFGLFKSVFVAVAERPPSTMGNPIFLGMYLLLLFFITVSFLWTEKNTYKRIYYACSLIIFSFAILLTGSRAAYLAMIAGFIIFILLYPKKSKPMKLAIVALVALPILVVIIANVSTNLPSFIKDNRVFTQVSKRLSVENLLNEGRFAEWKIAVKAIQEKPLLGWGPENYAIAHDKYYDPTISPLPWWDRAHNVFLDVVASAGIVGLIAYISLFAALFWHLHITKRNTEDLTKKIVITGVQSVIAAYLVADFFSFDSFSTYIIFFFIIAYCLYLTTPERMQVLTGALYPQWLKGAALAFLSILVAVFLWQYNWSPFIMNVNINKAQNSVNRQQCDPAFALMDTVLKTHNFLYAYARMQYVEFTIVCNIYHPENNVTYVQKGYEAISQAVQKRPLYTRYWLALGTYAGNLAQGEKDGGKKTEWLLKARHYLGTARELGPKHQDIIVEESKIEMIAGDYKKMEDYARECIGVDDRSPDCWWYLALSQIYQGKIDQAQTSLQEAYTRGYDLYDTRNLNAPPLINAYISMKDYKYVIPIYQGLIVRHPNDFQYHASLAYAYKLTGDYTNARKEAMIVLQLSPESKDSVEAFLRTLP